MWFKELDILHKQNGLATDTSILYNPVLEEELDYFNIRSFYPDALGKAIPQEVFIPDELLHLLKFSNGGLIVNGEREFGYFSLSEIRYYYFAYGFPKWATLFLPIAFNGGGVFYAYDFRIGKDIKVIATSAGDLGYDSSVVLGKTLKEVLSNPVNIEDELSKIYAPPTLSEKEQQRIAIRKELSKLKEDKEKGLIDLKFYLKTKRQLEDDLKKTD